jgi:dTDP-4-amino-4,6-dideoxygalactose transaminase
MQPVAFLPFNRPHTTGREFDYIREAIETGHLSGNGPFSARCSVELERVTGASTVLLTSSCTGALEMSALLADIRPGDEVIVPSFTFVTSASAFALRGAVPVFVDIRPDTLNLDETLLEAAITERTRAIVPIHYAGVASEMDPICELAGAHGITVIEDAAHGLLSRYRGRPLGGIGDLATFSFHETKNVICGEGGALVVNSPSFADRAHVLQEKGTNRRAFLVGQVDKYTWVDLGSSFAPSEILAAFLLAQLEEAERITASRLAIWQRYHDGFAELERQELVRRPVVPAHCEHNAHLFYLLCPDGATRDGLIGHLAQREINAVFHYVPLHRSPAGQRVGRASGSLPRTDDLAARLIRLPLWVGMTDDDVDRVVEEVADYVAVTVRSTGPSLRAGGPSS